MIKLFRFLKPYRFSIILAVLLIFLQSLANLSLPTLMADIIDEGIAKSDIAYILRTGLLMLIVGVLGAVAAITASFFSARTATGFARLLRMKLFTQVKQLSLHQFDAIGSASMITRTTNDTNQIQQFTLIMLNMMVSAPLMGIGGIILAAIQDSELAWILAVTVPILGIILVVVMRYAFSLFLSIQARLDRINLILDEKLKGVRVIRAFDRVKHEQQRFDRANSDLMHISIRVNRIVSALLPTMTLLMNLAGIAIIWFGGIRVNEGAIQVGSMIALLQYSMSIMFSVLMVSMMFMMLPRASASAARINDVLAMEPGTIDVENVRTVEEGYGKVTFENVTFSYPGTGKPVLSNITFTSRPGEVTAIIGGTGSGKSTLISLLLRFYEVESGRILINGVNIHEISQQHLRARIGFVPQKAFLFSGSVIDNMRYSKRDATEEEIWHALEVAQARDFVIEMDTNRNSRIGQGGVNLSGGQQQRLAIARALVRRPEIYIFDDSFSALDFHTEAKLRAALQKEIQHDAAVFLVAQRVSTVMDADQIIVLDEGRIVGMGKHHDLLKNCVVYREIVSTQLSLEELA